MAARKKLTRNLIWLYAGDLAGRGMALVAFFLLARALGERTYGNLEFAINVFFILFLVQEAGLDPFGSREAAKQPGEAGRLLAGIVTLRIGISLLALVILAAVAAVAPKPDSARLVLLLYGLVLVPAPFLLNWVFQSRDEMSVMAISSVLRQFVLLLGVLLFVRDAVDAPLVPVFDAAGLTVVVLMHWVLFRKRVGSPRLAGGIAEAKRIAAAALPLAGSSVAWAIRVSFPMVAVGIFWDEGSGLYGAGHRLVISLHAFAWLYFVNLLPSLSRASLEPERTEWRRLSRASMRLVSWGILPGCLALALLAPFLLGTLFGPEFRDGAPVFRVQIWMLALAFLSGHQRFSLIAFGQQRAEMAASIAGAVVAVAGCLLIRDRFGLEAIAGVFVAAEFTTLVAADLLLRRRVAPLAGLATCIPPLLLTTAVGAAARSLLRDAPWVTAIAGLAVGLAGWTLSRHLAQRRNP